MDLATLIGFIGACLVVATAILLGGSVGSFVDTASLVLVIGGTLLVTLMKFSAKQFLNAAKVAIKAFIYRVPDAEELIDKSVELANRARANGLLALEEADVPDEFFKKALNLVVDGHDPEVVRSILSKDLDLTLKRHRDGQAIFKAIGEAAPAMGMIGTIDAVMSIQDGQHPRVMQDLLKNYLPKSRRTDEQRAA